MATSQDKEQLECLNLLHVVGRGRRVLSYGCHGHNRGHRGGRLHHQVGSAGHRVWLRGHRHVLVMGRQHAHAIGHLGSDWLSSEGQKQKPTPICCMDGRRAHCCCMSIPCVIGPTWVGIRKNYFVWLKSPAEGQLQLPWGSVAPPRCRHLKDGI